MLPQNTGCTNSTEAELKNNLIEQQKKINNAQETIGFYDSVCNKALIQGKFKAAIIKNSTVKNAQLVKLYNLETKCREWKKPHEMSKNNATEVKQRTVDCLSTEYEVSSKETYDQKGRLSITFEKATNSTSSVLGNEYLNGTTDELFNQNVTLHHDTAGSNFSNLPHELFNNGTSSTNQIVENHMIIQHEAEDNSNNQQLSGRFYHPPSDPYQEEHLGNNNSSFDFWQALSNYPQIVIPCILAVLGTTFIRPLA